MRRFRIPITLLTLTLAASQSSAEINDNAGTKEFAFLKNGTGARAIAMGGAFTGLADDELSLYYNPGGLNTFHGARGVLGYQDFIAGIQSGFGAYVHPLDSTRSLAGYVNYITYGEFIRTNTNGVEEGTFGASTMVFGGAYGQRITERFSVGGVAKFIYRKLDSYTATGVAVDLGARYQIKTPGLRRSRRSPGFGSAGIAVQNLGSVLSTYTADAEKGDLPVVVRAGVGGAPKGIPVTFAADVIYPTDNDVYFALGAEYTRIRHLALRAGWTSFGSNFKTTGNESALGGFSFGLGFTQKQLGISYAFSPMNDLGEAHRVTLTKDFGPSADVDEER